MHDPFDHDVLIAVGEQNQISTMHGLAEIRAEIVPPPVGAWAFGYSGTKFK